MNLPQQTIDRITADALTYAEQQHGHDEPCKDYIEGALHEARRAQGLVDALELIGKKLKGINDAVTNDIVSIVNAVLAKYKEVSNG